MEPRDILAIIIVIVAPVINLIVSIIKKDKVIKITALFCSAVLLGIALSNFIKMRGLCVFTCKVYRI